MYESLHRAGGPGNFIKLIGMLIHSNSCYLVFNFLKEITSLYATNQVVDEVEATNRSRIRTDTITIRMPVVTQLWIADVNASTTIPNLTVDHLRE